MVGKARRSKSRSSCELTIASTGDGQAIDAAEQALVRLRLTARDLHVAVSAPFHGDPRPRGEPRSTPRLWEHEVVELFVAGEPVGAKVPSTEIELSPWSHHLVLRLHGIRRVVAAGLPIDFRAWRRGARWLGAAHLDRALLPPPPWRANAFAIHGRGSARRYLAAFPLPGERPDFHQPERFPALAIPGAE